MSRSGKLPDHWGGARTLRPLAALLLLAGCGQNDTDPGPGGVTVGEARALDEAAEMLEQQRRTPSPTETPPDNATPAR